MTNRAAATRYARALFDVVLKEGDPQRAGSDLAAFSDILTGNAALHRVLVNPAIPPARKRAAMEAMLAKAGEITPAVAKLFLLLAERDRLGIVAEVVQAYRVRLLQHQHIVQAEVTTAVPLPEDRRAALEYGLASVTGQRVTLTVRVDPAIIGGAVTRVGSTVYDGSIVRQLERLREQLAAGA
ncbi:MAG TPA: ATP synthase F1 subunit delta [Vicinamibacterales bacterium]|nr:ATP synthase F1 subunit delta [Vicinamibacterales bacterium]